jgi:PIN domain nuclease of toxin-antitoxin system
VLYLLDTHAVLWLLAGDARASGALRELAKPRATVLLSAVCLWEVAIKRGLGKLSAPADLPDRLDAYGFEPLPITASHAWGVQTLPPHHNDPFDRLLVAQAQIEGATVVSRDEAFDAYGVPRLW